MENLDLYYLCKTIGNLAGIPIRIFENKKLTFYYDLVNLPKDPLCVYYDDVMGVQDNVGYFITKHFYYYGIVNSGNVKLVLGPTSQVNSQEQEYRELAFRADVPSEDVDDFVNGMKDIVRMPFESILQILCTLNYIMNGEKLELKDITIYDTEQNDLRNLLGRQQAAKNLSNLSEEVNPIKEAHNSFSQEQLLMDLVRKGDTATLRQWIASAPAIRGGMDPDEAFSLSDAFIRKCELLNTPQHINNLQYHMLLDCTERVEQIRHGKYPSRLTLDVANYVHHHLYETISAEDIAHALYISRPYLSLRFKEEMGETLTDFILKEKTEEAKRLLRYTDKTATMIGSYLGFSSQSHFSRVFRKYTGQTPAEYRKKYS